MHAPIYGLGLMDLAFIALYFVAIVFITTRAARTIHNREDFFMAGRRFGKVIQTFAAFGQATSIENVTTTTTVVYANGVFRPEQPVNIPEHSRLRISIHEPAPSTNGAYKGRPLGEILNQLRAQGLVRSGGWRPTREELHERP